MKRLSAPSMACLRHMLTSGVCSARELEDVQRQQPNGWNRSATAVKHTPHNLETLGYIRRVASTSATAWELTEQGRAVLQLDGQNEAPLSALAPTTVAAVPARAVAYGKSFVHIPVVPRWVFDLGGAL